MTATTELYLQLQRAYREAAEADAAAVERRARAELQRLGRDPASLPRSAVAAFVRNARNIRRACTLLPDPPPLLQVMVAAACSEHPCLCPSLVRGSACSAALPGARPRLAAPLRRGRLRQERAQHQARAALPPDPAAREWRQRASDYPCLRPLPLHGHTRSMKDPCSFNKLSPWWQRSSCSEAMALHRCAAGQRAERAVRL